MRGRQRRSVGILALGLLAAGCGGRDALWDLPRDVAPPVALAVHAAWLDRSLEDLVTVRPVERSGGGFGFEVERQRVGRNPVFVLPSADGTRALVMTHGTEGGPGVAPEGERLYVVDPSAEASAVVYEMHSPFDRLTPTADGTAAMAWFGGGGR